MAIKCYLAMTAAEFQNCSSFPDHLGWMSCHFSPYRKGLSNIPASLPPQSMLILDDSNPINGHDPQTVLSQLSSAVNTLDCSCVLLDFQRPDCKEAAAMARQLVGKLPCPVGVTHLYAESLPCPILVPPVPPDVPIVEHLKPWEGREIWLELALSSIGYRITADGATEFHPTTCPETSLSDDKLCCHYAIDIQPNAVDFTLLRTAEDLSALMKQAAALGVACCVGLWQELGKT